MEHDTSKAKKVYHQLNQAQREAIAIGLEQGKSLSQIARELGVDKSTVSRELKQNNAPVNEVKYRGNRAHKRADARKRNSHRRERLADPFIRDFVEQGLKNGWTPEAIAGRLPLEHPGVKTNYETICGYDAATSFNICPRGASNGINGVPASKDG
ncbi:MAG: helix-turn-helix domain-containing protein [Treponema sp.]|jgi:IS30 family transposase|nr:helix-turn-helix domain-containing protein [Treponema sp.]